MVTQFPQDDVTSGTLTIVSEISEIQNSPQMRLIIPTAIDLPVVGDKYVEVFGYMYDTAGNPEDPDSNDFAVKLVDISGNDESSFYDDSGGITPATVSAIDGTYYKMVRISEGVYHTFLKVTTTDDREELYLKGKVEEDAILLQFAIPTRIGSVPADVTYIRSKVDDIETDTQDIQSQVGTAGAGLSAIPDMSLDSTVSKEATAAKDATVAKETTIGTPSATVSADISAIKTVVDDIETDTQDLQAQIGTAGDGLTAIPGMSGSTLKVLVVGSKTIATGVTKHLELDSGTDGFVMESMTIKGVVGADWTLGIYVPAADAVAAPAADDKRKTIPYVNTDTEGGQITDIGGAGYNMFFDFTNDSVGSDDIDAVIILYRSAGTITGVWEV